VTWITDAERQTILELLGEGLTVAEASRRAGIEYSRAYRIAKQADAIVVRRRRKPPRATSNCDCGGPCFYCHRALGKHDHHHDHFPVPYRHGGEETVPACRECHRQKEGAPIDDQAVLEAAVRGMAGLPALWVVGDDLEAERVPLIVCWLYEHIRHPVVAGDGPYWLQTVEGEARTILEEIAGCSTPEARIWLAHVFTFYLDQLDRALEENGAA
jgi:hypothetical protein